MENERLPKSKRIDMKILIKKIKIKFWNYIVRNTKDNTLYPLLYKSYWYYLFSKNGESSGDKSNSVNYYTVIPNPGAGIGHQMANWISGYWFSEQFNLKHIHTPFSNVEWDVFLGLGENEMRLSDVIEAGYKKVRLPLFDEKNRSQVQLQKKIIDSYRGSKIVFIGALDQFYEDQYGVLKHLQDKFYNAKIRKTEKLFFNDDEYNVAVHVRRGDIVVGNNKDNENHIMRWLTNDYFVNVLKNALQKIETKKKIKVYLFSQGKEEDYKEFKIFDNVEYCLEIGAKESFLHMVYADLLITSKSSFSYKPALLNKGLKIVPIDFWHGYPSSEDWIKVDNNGEFIY